jgi:uncharacterized membrane protein/uncharacterized membrane protein YeaQ/YmgE (transglycosylase-associated protein family)
MQAWIWLATGVLTGWLAGKLMKGHGYGLSGHLILGILGSLLGGWLFEMIGLSAPRELWRHFAVSVVGAMLALGAARRLRVMALGTQRALGGSGPVADLEATIRRLGDFERTAIDRLLRRGTHRDPSLAFEEQMTFGERVADLVAKFGGSWTFIGLFLLTMLVWMIINTELRTPFDPFPFILLNLVLSCVAALQAPVILMSQNRQEGKDRIRAEHDYVVNLKAELEIRLLHTKVDQLLTHQWQRLLEIQQLQVDLIEDLGRRGKGA